MKRALITGSLGQDGIYLSEYLLSLGYQVTGMVRYATELSQNLSPEIRDRVSYVYGDIRDKMSIEVAVHKSNPDEIYNLAGQTFVPPSWPNGADTFDVNVGGLARILEVVSVLKPDAKVYQASSSEMYGIGQGRLNESSPFNPVSPYGVSKLAAHKLANVYRLRGLFVSCGILFNHESPLRGPEMVTRKIAKAVAKWTCGHKDILKLGNLDARRDWGFAGDYVKAMHAILQLPSPDDFVVGTGEAHSVLDFLNAALNCAGMLEAMKYVQVDQNLKRGNDIGYMAADYAKAQTVLGWQPTTNFEQLVKLMVDHDIELLKPKVSAAAVSY